MVVLFQGKHRQAPAGDLQLIVDERTRRVVGWVGFDSERHSAGCPPWEAWWVGQPDVVRVGVCFFESLRAALLAARCGLLVAEEETP